MNTAITTRAMILYLSMAAMSTYRYPGFGCSFSRFLNHANKTGVTIRETTHAAPTPFIRHTCRVALLPVCHASAMSL
jgi:hypothetical protein